MNVLIACEFSGIVRDAFLARGHNALSCDLLPSESKNLLYHYHGDVLDLDVSDFDLMIAHPPCTHLASSGARWFKGKAQEQADAITFVRQLLAMPITRIAIENPIGVLSSHIGKPSQIIQPWQFGHGETKATCLWLKGLPLLKATDIVEGRANRIHMMPGSKDQAKNRSRTYAGIANAMAEQWGLNK